MGKLETFQKIGEVGTKAFDNMEDDEKKEGFKTLIEDLDGSDTATRLKKQRDSIPEEDKLKLYKRGAITLSASIKNSSPIPTYYNAIKNTTKKGIKTAAKIALLEQIPCRFFVELGILQKPESLTKEKLIKDVKKDAKHFNTYLSICSTVCACIPQARVAVPFIQMGKHYAKRYKKHGTELLITRLDEQEKEKIKEQTQEQLSHIIAA